MKLVARKTFAAELQGSETAQPLLDYYVQAELERAQGGIRVTAPLEAPARFYTVAII
jgi:hypothetical protein